MTYAIIIVFAIIQLAFYQRTESFEPDSSFYIGLAQSLLQHGTYEFNFKPHVQYPPGFPAILAFLSLLFGATYRVFILSMPVFGAIGLIESYRLLRDTEDRTAACTGCLLLISAPYFFSMTTEVINADLPFFVASMLSLLLARKVEEPTSGWRRYVIWSGFILSLVASILIRTVGIALFFGLVAWICVSWWTGQKRFREIARYAPVFIVGAVVQGLWFRWTWKAKQNLAQAGSSDYLSYILQKDPHRPDLGRATVSDLFSRVGHNLIIQSAHLVELLSRKAWVDPLWYSPLIAGCIVFISIGLIISLRRHGGSYPEWYFLCYAGIYLLWPFDVGPRFLLPAFPLAFLYAWRGVLWIGHSLADAPRAVAPYAVLASGALCGGALVSIRASNGMVSGQAKLNVVLAGLSALGFALICSHRVQSIWSGIRSGIESVPGNKVNLQTIGSVALAVLFAGGFTIQLAMIPSNLSKNPDGDVHRPSAEAASWIAKKTSNGTVMAGEEAIVHRISGRKVAFLPVTSAPDRLVKAIDDQDARFIIVVCERASNMFPTEPERLRLLTSTHPDLLRLVQEGPCYQVLQVVGESAAVVH